MCSSDLGRVHGEPHDLDAFYIGPMQGAVRILAGQGHEAAAAAAGRVRALAQTGQVDEARASRRDANKALRALPAAAFPAVASAALIKPDAPEPFKRLRLFWAVLRGRI